MNSIWNNNISAFSKRFPGLAEAYKDIINLPKETLTKIWSVTQAKNGSYTASEENLRLHSTYNPDREAEQGVNGIISSKKNTIVFMGFGLGYHVCKLAEKLWELKKIKDTKVVVIEPDPVHFFAALCFIDWTKVFDIEKLVLAIGCPIDSIMSLLENQNQIVLGEEGVSDAFFFTLPAFTNHAQNYFDTVKILIERNKSKNDINAATYEKFGKLWARNSIKNINALSVHRTLAQFREALINRDFSDKPFLLIAAGPSLENILPYVKELQKKAVLVCVETALHSLLRAGVQPDFILLTDPQFWAYRHIAGLKAPDSILICPISVYPATFRFECKEILVCSDMFPISQFFEKQKGTFGDLGAGGSVASSAWNMCHFMGAKTIYTAGLDLSFPTKQTHIRGSSSEQTIHTISNKLFSVDKASARTLHSGNPEYAENYLGNKVLTDNRMKMFAWWFESRIASCPEIKTFTLTPESMKIPGIQIGEVCELLALPDLDRNKLFEEKLDSIKHSDFNIEIKAYNKAVNELSSIINTAVEKSMINGPDLQKELELIQLQIEQNPLKEIVHLGKPSKKYLSEHQNESPELLVYKKLQKEIGFYK